MYAKSWVNELMLRSEGTVTVLGEFVAVLVPPQAVAMIAIKLALAVNVKRLKSMGLSSRC
jgi:Mg2+/citrate symporter